jgi:hypothetical protein
MLTKLQKMGRGKVMVEEQLGASVMMLGMGVSGWNGGGVDGGGCDDDDAFAFACSSSADFLLKNCIMTSKYTPARNLKSLQHLLHVTTQCKVVQCTHDSPM